MIAQTSKNKNLFLPKVDFQSFKTKYFLLKMNSALFMNPYYEELSRPVPNGLFYFKINGKV